MKVESRGDTELSRVDGVKSANLRGVDTVDRCGGMAGQRSGESTTKAYDRLDVPANIEKPRCSGAC